MKIWTKTKKFFEGKFLVIRRDGSVPAWPHFVLGARDPAVPAALRAYAREADRLHYDPEFVKSVHALAAEFEAYRLREGNGDADAAPHRKDDPETIRVMRGDHGTIIVWHEAENKPKIPGSSTPFVPPPGS